ncbi:MAG: hypothetical protein HRK26_00625 [Rickettsiaceae bacterium H1]|nr:hypothetical protein [Rickettsiaceae bacterium H1]
MNGTNKNYRRKFFDGVLSFNDRIWCGVIVYPIIYCLGVGFTLGILNDLGKIKISGLVVAAASLSTFFSLLLLGMTTLCTYPLGENEGKYPDQDEYPSFATNPLAWLAAPSAYLLGASVDGVIAAKHCISSKV